MSTLDRTIDVTSTRHGRRIVVCNSNLSELSFDIARYVDGPFGVYIATRHTGKLSDLDKQAVAKTLVYLGCRTLWCSGPDSSAWEDAADAAIVAMFQSGSGTVPHDLYRGLDDSRTVLTARATEKEVLLFFRHDELLAPLGPLTARILVTDDEAVRRAAKRR